MTLAKDMTKLFGLEGGGYAFTSGPSGLGERVVVWEDPDLDYLLGYDAVPDYYSLECPVLALAPSFGLEDVRDLPSGYRGAEGVPMGLVAKGDMHPGVLDCECYQDSGSPDPGCLKCDGKGYLSYPGGVWAIYDSVEP